MDLSKHTSRILDVSTGHIPRPTADALGNTGRDSCPGAALWNLLPYEPWADYGCLIYVSGTSATEVEGVGHPELGALIRFAEEHGFDYLKLDCDARNLPPEAGLPTFDW